LTLLHPNILTILDHFEFNHRFSRDHQLGKYNPTNLKSDFPTSAFPEAPKSCSTPLPPQQRPYPPKLEAQLAQQFSAQKRPASPQVHSTIKRKFTSADFPPLGNPPASSTIPLNYSLLSFPNPINLCARQLTKPPTKAHRAPYTRLHQPPSAPSRVAPPAPALDNRMAPTDHPPTHVDGLYTLPSPRM
jgi:hypothetical protein